MVYTGCSALIHSLWKQNGNPCSQHEFINIQDFIVGKKQVKWKWMRKRTSKMHKATLFIEIICHKLGEKGLTGTQMYGQNPDTAKHVTGKGYLIIFLPCLCKQAVFPWPEQKALVLKAQKLSLVILLIRCLGLSGNLAFSSLCEHTQKVILSH